MAQVSQLELWCEPGESGDQACLPSAEASNRVGRSAHREGVNPWRIVETE